MANTTGTAADPADGTGREPDGPARGGPFHGTRREMMRGLLAPALALSMAPLIAASAPAGAARPAPPLPGAEPPSGGRTATRPLTGAVFDETYRGHRIRGVRTAADRSAEGDAWHVTVDGRPLHLMRRADGTWLSMIDHYQSYPTPLDAARAAVDEMGPGARLNEEPSDGGRTHLGGHRGVHA
ncbi:tyrosinase family oxidase copper chaperone [Streptomyces sp. NPDC052077]|uniref:tyrosinase family oxidase copper chaperone n=1 Tax=Streptomyces sp. NPDC052077 TaxID=3154757 RepID=UPI003434D646